MAPTVVLDGWEIEAKYTKQACKISKLLRNTWHRPSPSPITQPPQPGHSAQSFLDSEKRLLRELYDYLVVFLPPSGAPPGVPRDHGDGSGIVTRSNASSSSVATSTTTASSDQPGLAVGRGPISNGCPTTSSEDGDITIACSEDPVVDSDASGSGSDTGTGSGRSGLLLSSHSGDEGRGTGDGGEGQ